MNKRSSAKSTKIKLSDSTLKTISKLRQEAIEAYENKEWYTIRALLGNDWANWFVLIGAR